MCVHVYGRACWRPKADIAVSASQDLEEAEEEEEEEEEYADEDEEEGDYEDEDEEEEDDEEEGASWEALERKAAEGARTQVGAGTHTCHLLTRRPRHRRPQAEARGG